MNVIHQVLAYADDVNLIGYDIRTTERSTYMLLNAFKAIDLSVNTWKPKYMEVGCNRGVRHHGR